MTSILVAACIPTVIGAIVAAVQQWKLGQAREQLATEKGTSAALKRQLDEKGAALDAAQKDAAQERAAHQAEVAEFQAHLRSAEDALVQTGNAHAVGAWGRSVLTGQADPPASGARSGEPAVPGRAAS